MLAKKIKKIVAALDKLEPSKTEKAAVTAAIKNRTKNITPETDHNIVLTQIIADIIINCPRVVTHDGFIDVCDKEVKGTADFSVKSAPTRGRR